jgi:hypothetical protein
MAACQHSSQEASTLTLFRASLIAVLFLTSKCRARPIRRPSFTTRRAENLEHIDVALIDGAEHEIASNDGSDGRLARPEQ